MATINPRQIFLDTLNSNKANSNYNLQEASSSPKSYGTARTTIIKNISFNSRKCVSAQMHSTLINNGTGALYPASNSTVWYVDSTSGTFIANSMYQSNVYNVLTRAWLVATDDSLAIPLSYDTNSTQPVQLTGQYQVRGPVLSIRELFKNQSDPYNYGQLVTTTTVPVRLTISNVIINSQQHLSFKYEILSATSPSTLIWNINITSKTLTSIIGVGAVYQGTAVPRFDTIIGTKSSNF